MQQRAIKSNHLFTGAFVLAGVLLGAHFADAIRPQFANAQVDTPFNSAEQRRQMIDQLKEVNQRLTRMESQLKGGIDVRVKEMPPAPKDKN